MSREASGREASDKEGPPTGRRPFHRHKHLDYQGYAFPWYATLLWIGYFVGAVLYLVRHILLE